MSKPFDSQKLCFLLRYKRGGEEMELGKHIKKYRMEAEMSQEELAQKVYVSRQTISNWENDKSYPDVKSLVLLSEIFEISLDILVKGDIEIMKREIDTHEQEKFENNSKVFAVLLIAMLILPVPLVMLFKWCGMATYVLIAGAGMYYAFKLERFKKENDIQTYKEIVAFTEGKPLDSIEKAKEEAKRPYQKVLLAAGSALITLVVAGVMFLVFRGVV